MLFDKHNLLLLLDFYKKNLKSDFMLMKNFVDYLNNLIMLYEKKEISDFDFDNKFVKMKFCIDTILYEFSDFYDR